MTEEVGAVGSLRDELRRLRIELRILNDAVARSAGLNPRDLDVLDVIDREGPCTPSQLADRTGHRRATLTSVLARLRRDRWIAQEPHPDDSRSVTLTSTTRFDELRALYARADSVDALLEREFTVDQRRDVTRAMALITEHLREAPAIR